RAGVESEFVDDFDGLFEHFGSRVMYSGLTKTSTALPRLGSKGTILQGAEAPGEPVPYYPYCLRPAALS
ncbi:hypothetical protein, partial [Neisseria gonorrhoeae]|uniref:hypothetical protein n=2 Tax=Neisseria gonorrhoeae TaxID=485 RepID=UPI001C57C25A